MSGNPPGLGDADARQDEDEKIGTSILDLLLRGAQANLDGIEEPTAADLAALDELEDPSDFEATLDEAVELQPALALLAEPEEPELVSLESLDDVDEPASSVEDLEDVEDLLDDVESLIEDYVDIDLEDDDLDDEGYDLDDEDISSYHDLYGDDDAIIPSFREGEFAEEEGGDAEYYDDLR